MPPRYLTLNDGQKIPQIGFGTGTKFRGTDVSPLVTAALQAGFTHLDAAQIYKNEDTVGASLVGIDRSTLYITSKFFSGDIEETCRDSLAKFGISYFDLYLVHMPRALQPDPAAKWQEFEELQRRGLARSIGVSNYTLEQLQDLLRHASVKPAVNQVRLHLYCYHEQKPLVDFCNEQGILVAAYNVLTPLTYGAGGPLYAPLAELAKRRNCTLAQVIFLWTLAKGVVAITTTSNEQRMHEALDAVSLEPLTDDEISMLEAAGAQGSSVDLNEIMCKTCAGYNCTYCDRLAQMSAEVKMDDVATREVLNA